MLKILIRDSRISECLSRKKGKSRNKLIGVPENKMVLLGISEKIAGITQCSPVPPFVPRKDKRCE